MKANTQIVKIELSLIYLSYFSSMGLVLLCVPNSIQYRLDGGGGASEGAFSFEFFYLSP